MLGRLGVRYVAAAFPIVDLDCQLQIAGCQLQPVGQFDEVYVYRNEKAQPVADVELSGGIVLSDGVALFRYRPWPVYAGWVVSSVTVLSLLAGWLVGGLRRRCGGG